MFWSNKQPKVARALHSSPSSDRPGEIQIALHIGTGDRVRPLSFDELWSCAVFELNNAANAPEFLELHAKALSGKIVRDDYVREFVRLEHLAAAKTRRFYVTTF